MKQENKHTPAPWSVSKAGYCKASMIIDENADLIAADPKELLEALEMMLNLVEKKNDQMAEHGFCVCWNSPEQKKAKQAINKARGEI